MQAKYRKYKDLLIVTGTGVIAFGVWSVIRVLLMFILGSSETEGAVAEIMSSGIPTVLFYVALIIILMIPLGIHLFIGLSARSEGYGKKKRYVYIVFAFILAVLFGFSLISNTYNTVIGEQELDINRIISYVVDLTVLFVLIQMIISSIQVKRLAKILAKEEAKCS